MLGVSRPIYVNVDSPNLGFPYFIGGYQWSKKHPVYEGVRKARSASYPGWTFRQGLSVRGSTVPAFQHSSVYSQCTDRQLPFPHPPSSYRASPSIKTSAPKDTFPFPINCFDIPHLFNVHVNGHPLLCDPRHVLWAPDVDLGDGVGWVLVEHHRDVPRVLAPTHVLLVGALKLDTN